MKTKQLWLMILCMICCVSWSLHVFAVEYNPTVERGQRELAMRGYDPGQTNGEMGQETVAAIKKFQEENTLPVTGEFDEATLKKLNVKPPQIKCRSSRCIVENGLTEEMVSQIKQFFAEQKKADGLTLKNAVDNDLKHLPALDEGLVDLIVMYSEFLTDITPLGTLTKLEKLRLESLPMLTDLTPLSKLTGLKTIDLSKLGEPLTLSPLATLAHLERINLDTLNWKGEEPFDISALAGKPNLKTLSLYRVKADDLTPLQDSPELNKLELSIIATDLTPLKTLKKLYDLVLRDMPATDLSPLAELTKLQYLHIINLDVTDLSPLKNLKNLRSLTLDRIPAKDMSPVGELTELTKLTLFETQFSDYSPIANCTKLDWLTAQDKGEGFNKLAVISSMPNLHTLSLKRNTNIQEWDALATATNLKDLAVEETSFRDLTLLANLKKLQKLEIGKCTVTNPEAIATLPELKRLNIRGTKGIEDLMIFKGLPKLVDLQLVYDKDQFTKEQIDAFKKVQEEARKKKQ